MNPLTKPIVGPQAESFKYVGSRGRPPLPCRPTDNGSLKSCPHPVAPGNPHLTSSLNTNIQQSDEIVQTLISWRTVERYVKQSKMRGSNAGITDSLKGKSHTHYALLSVLDTMFSSLVVAPAVVGYWRSTWNLTVIYLYPDDPVKSAMMSVAIGFIGHLVFGVSQHALTNMFHPEKHRIIYYTMSRLYTSCYAFTCVNSWRGAWDLLDYYTGSDASTVFAITSVSVISLAAMRSLRNVSAAPFSVVMDSVDGYFEVPTMFKMSSDKTSLYILDCIFSVFVIGSLVVFVWRCAWVLLDIFLFEEDFIWSSWVSLILGYAIVAMAFSMQPAMRWLCDRLTGFVRIFVADVFMFFSIIGTINVWRGIWNLLEIYFLPDHPEISSWTIHWVSLFLLILLNCSNSLLIRGVYIDAEEPAGKCVVFPIYYLRLIFKNERQKKRIKNIQLEDMAKRKHEIDCLKPKNENYHPEISNWTTHWVCLVLLILLNCSNSLLVRGVYIDAEEPAGKCVVFPIYYLRLIFKNERQKKRLKNVQLEVMVKRKHEIDCLKPKNENCTCISDQNHMLLLQTLEPNYIDV